MKFNWFKHLKVVMRHKKYVFHECCKCGIPFRGLKHDLSKFSLREFIPSTRHFQGNRSPIKAEKEERGYSLAWQHHMGHNPHHWQYWVDYADDGNLIPVKMPYKCVIELMCDWIGAGKAYNQTEWNELMPLVHYGKTLWERHMHPETDYLVFMFCMVIQYYGIKGFYEAARNKALKEIYEKGRIDYVTVLPPTLRKEDLYGQR